MNPFPMHSMKTTSALLSLSIALFALVFADIALGAEPNNSEPFHYQPLDPGKQAFLIDDAVNIEDLFVRRDLRYRHSDLEDMLARIAGRITLPKTDDYIDYRFFLIRDPSPISFSLADGQVYLYSGLLARLENEAQVASVLAHEIHHVAAHHHIDAKKSRRSRDTGLQVAAAVADYFLPLGGALRDTTNFLAMNATMKFDLDYEIAADRHALKLLLDAGYDPHSAPRVLELLANDPEFVLPRPVGNWTTVDELRERRNRLDALIKNLSTDNCTETLESETNFLQLTRPLLELTIDDYIRMGHPRIAIAFVENLLSTAPSASLYAAMGDARHALGPGSDLPPQKISGGAARRLKRMTRAEINSKAMATDAGQANYRRHLEMAQQSYRTALELNPDEARAHLGLGDLLYERANYRASAKHFIRYLQLSPNATNKLIVMEKLQTIRSQLQHEKEKE